MKLYSDSEVYVFCPGNVQTGGPESLHQLASCLISLGVNAYMVYYKLNDKDFDADNPVHDAYKKYQVPYKTYPRDHQRNIAIFPETATSSIYTSRKIQCVIWWMSVDNYLENLVNIFEKTLKAPLAEPMQEFFTFDKTDRNIEHWAKCEYVRQFLELNGIPANKISHVETYMNEKFFEQAKQINLKDKKNIVAYNPKKGFEITKQIIAVAPEIDWRPIENMTPAQVQELLAQAKVYIDFGEHPGRDRLPREATISKCVVITGKRGAAANDLDYNIPAEFKFGLNDSRPRQVTEKIQVAFENFERELDKQKNFRQRVYDDKNNFTTEVAAAFGINKVYRGRKFQ